MGDTGNDEQSLVPCPGHMCGSSGSGLCGVCGGSGEVTVGMYNDYMEHARPITPAASEPVFRSRRAYEIEDYTPENVAAAAVRCSGVPDNEVFVAYWPQGEDGLWYIGARCVNSAVSLLEGHRYYGYGKTLVDALVSFKDNVWKTDMEDARREQRLNSMSCDGFAGTIMASAITARHINMKEDKE